ncbi:hypothetical protein Q1695_004497 [Nippostrongylus brasiliensis]|nr:hypothetical protein Q1695_004497 [Nippostrongylus brasiliensis]
MQSFPQSEQNPIMEIKTMIAQLAECMRVFSKVEEVLSHFIMATFYLVMAVEKTEYPPDNTRALAAQLIKSMKAKDAEAAVRVAHSVLAGISK